MLNTVAICGRLVSDPQINETKNGRKVTYITVAVPRAYKNVDGIYETDFIRCILWNGIAESCCEYCKKGDLLGIKGRLQSSITTDDGNTIDETKKYNIELIAERVSFLSSRSE